MPVAAGLYYFAHNLHEHNCPPVILIHGAGGTHLSWPAEIRRLPGQRMLAVDLPGHGKSPGLGKHSIPEYSRSLLDFMDALGIYKAIIVGHSMGGGIAMDLALDYPEYVIGLGLIASNARLRVAQAVLDGLALPATVPATIQAIIEWSFGPQVDADFKRLAASRLEEIRPAVLSGDMQACNNFNVIQRLPEINMPTLIVCGTEDKMTPLRYSESMAVSIPNAALQTIDSAGHMVALEQPRRVAGILNIFIKSIDYIPGV